MILRLATANENGRRGCRGGPVWPPEPPTQGRPYGFTDCKGSWDFHRRHEGTKVHTGKNVVDFVFFVSFW